MTTVVRAKRTCEEVSSGHLSLRKLRHTLEKLLNVIRGMNCPSTLGVRRISMVVWVCDLDDQIERLVDNPSPDC